MISAPMISVNPNNAPSPLPAPHPRFLRLRKWSGNDGKTPNLHFSDPTCQLLTCCVLSGMVFRFKEQLSRGLEEDILSQAVSPL